MKVAVIAQPKFPIKPPFLGGLEAFTHTLTTHLSHKYDVALYAHPESETIAKLISFPLSMEDLNKNARATINDYLIRLSTQAVYDKCDIIHNNSISSIPTIWAAKAGIPVIQTLHTPPYTSIKAATEYVSLYPRVRYVAVSRYIANLWQPYISTPIQIIHNGIELDSWSIGNRTRRGVFTMGRISPTKGIDLAIKAALAIGEDVAFAGPLVDKKYYKDCIKPLLRIENVNYLGHLTHAEPCKYLAESKVSIFAPRWDEPFGLATLESIASGTPVASYNRGAFPEIVTEKSGSLARGTNLRSLINATEMAMECANKEVAEDAKRFPMSRMIDEYSNLLMSLTHESINSNKPNR